ncbi:arylsulfatase [Streptomyces daliensis]
MNVTSRRQFLAGSAAALGLGGLTASVAAMTGGDGSPGPGSGSGPYEADPLGRRRPNIVLVVADDLGQRELGAYGQRLIKTPRLDEVAAEGMRFTQAYAAAAVCAPSRCSLLTGMHAGHARVRQNPFNGAQGALGDADTTFAEVLRERGYRTGCVGKWGFGPEVPDQPSHPNSRGFDEFYGYLTHHQAHDYYPAYLWDNGERASLPGNTLERRTTYAPDLFRRRALDFIRRHADEPFLLYLTPNSPHAPSRAPHSGPYAAAYEEERGWSRADKAHAAQVGHLDATVGMIVDALRREGIEKDTVLLFTSDNGPHEEGGTDPDLFVGKGPLRGYKRNLYEGGIRVPLLAWSPGRIAAGGSSDRPTPLIDMLPTLAHLGGARAPGGIDGLSAAPLIDGSRGTPKSHSYLYWYRNDPISTPRADAVDKGRGNTVCEALRQDDWKAVRFAPGRDRLVPDDEWDVELYDLREDPGERHDLAARHPEVADRMVRRMRRAWSDRPRSGALEGAEV